MTKYFISLDFDGCLFNTAYLEALKLQPVNRSNSIIKANQSLMNFIISRTEKSKDVVLLIGSNRQSNKLDVNNGLKSAKSFKSTEYPNSGSCYSSLIYICKELNNPLKISDKDERIERFRIDKFLLADLYNNKPEGYSFDLGLTNKVWNDIDNFVHQNLSPTSDFSHPETITDATKITLLYAQIHKVVASAAVDGNESIIFDFIDDLDSILGQVGDFFKLHSDMLPKNVTLNLIRYPNPSGPTVYCTIQGTGNIDYNYRKNVIQFAKLGGFDVSQNDLSKAIKTSHVYSIIDEFKLIRRLEIASNASPLAKNSKKRSFFETIVTDVQNKTILTITPDIDDDVKISLPAFKRTKG